MEKINNIKTLKEETGCSYSVANKVLEFCKDVKIALEFLKLRGQAIARYRIVDDQRVPWDDIDYYMEAKEIVERGKK